MVKIICCLFGIFILLINLNYISSASFAINSADQITINPYRGDWVYFRGIIQADSGNYCDIRCQYTAGSNSGYVSDSGNLPASQLEAGQVQEFPFSIRAEGEGTMNQELAVVCDRVVNYFNCWPGSETKSKIITFSFLHPDDGICTPAKEKCASYGSFLGTEDCKCGVGKECRPNGDRSPDEKGCQGFCGNGIYESEFEDCSCWLDFNCSSTKKCRLENGRTADKDGCVTFCGNGICEKTYENCTSCSSDCKKCNLMNCQKDSECEGGYCVWNLCWNNDYRLNDSHCDSTKGENCANSIVDCSCSSNKKCNSGGFCETYCGNGVCELGEIGICKPDCKWCGNGVCDSTENCFSCEVDCGYCKDEIINSTTNSATITNLTDSPENPNNQGTSRESENNISDEAELNESSSANEIGKESKYAFNRGFLKENLWQIMFVIFGIIVIIFLVIIILRTFQNQETFSLLF